MQSTSLTQVLLRNPEHLTATSILLINMPADNLVAELVELNNHKNIHCLDFFYNQHLGHTKQLPEASCTFDANYNTKDKQHDLVIMQFPKSKQELQFTFAMIAKSLTAQARILIIGDNKGGIKSLPKLLKPSKTYCDKIDSARHCILFDISLPAQESEFELSNWFKKYSFIINDVSIEILALPGVFSQAKLDVGTRVLLENLPNEYDGKLLDFGCGAGVIASYLGKQNPNLSLSLTDINALAIASSKATLKLNGLNGLCFPTDSLSSINEQYDSVVTNPPFHQGVKTHYAATESFLGGINRFIRKSGNLTVVANNFLQYQPILESNFGEVNKTTVKDGFTVYFAKKN